MQAQSLRTLNPAAAASGNPLIALASLLFGSLFARPGHLRWLVEAWCVAGCPVLRNKQVEGRITWCDTLYTVFGPSHFR